MEYLSRNGHPRPPIYVERDPGHKRDLEVSCPEEEVWIYIYEACALFLRQKSCLFGVALGAVGISEAYCLLVLSLWQHLLPGWQCPPELGNYLQNWEGKG